MRKALIDVVAKAIGPNTALVYITVFGSRSTVMVVNARSRRLIATMHRYHDGISALDHDSYKVVEPGGAIVYSGSVLSSAIWAVKSADGYAHGANQNYSRAKYLAPSF
jgi:hypothetical protein